MQFYHFFPDFVINGSAHLSDMLIMGSAHYCHIDEYKVDFQSKNTCFYQIVGDYFLIQIFNLVNIFKSEP